MITVSYTFQDCAIKGHFDVFRVTLGPAGLATSMRIGATRPVDDAVVLAERLNMAAIKMGLHPSVQPQEEVRS